MTLKIDLINGAYSKLRISGLTVIPGGEEIALGLERLEDMAEQWEGRNVCTGYFFEENPDPNTPHNVPRKFWSAYKANLAMRLVPDFGKQIDPSLAKEAAAGFSFVSAKTALIREVNYPSRQPIGSGNSLRYSRYTRFYVTPREAPLSCETVTMFIDDIDDFFFDFSAYLVASEDIATYTLTAIVTGKRV